MEGVAEPASQPLDAVILLLLLDTCIMSIMSILSTVQEWSSFTGRRGALGKRASVQPLRSISGRSCCKVGVGPWRHAPWSLMAGICHGAVDDVTAAQNLGPRYKRSWGTPGRISGRRWLTGRGLRSGDGGMGTEDGAAHRPTALLKLARLAMTMTTGVGH